MSKPMEQIKTIHECLENGKEKEAVAPLTMLIEIKEVNENQFVHQGFGQEQLFEESKNILYQILKKFPLNGRAYDTRYELRKNAMILLSLFFSTVMCRDAETIKTYIQVCFHVILTDGEEIASFAFSTLKQYLELYESNNPPEQLVNLNEFKEEIFCYVEGFFFYLGNFSQALQQQILKADDVCEVQQILSQPLIPFAEMQQKVRFLPRQNEDELAADSPQIQPIPGQVPNDPSAQPPQTIPGVDLSLGPPTARQLIQDTRKFAVYGSRSLQFGGELLSSLLCQLWDIKSSHRYKDPNGPRLINSFKAQYLGVFEKALVTPRNSQINWNQVNSGPAFKYLKCLTQIIHLMKNLIMNVVHLQERLQMNHFFEFIIALLRSIPQHENLLRYLVLNQFNDIMFAFIFGGNQEIRADFQEQVKSQFLEFVNAFLSESSDMVLLTLKQVSNPVILEQQLLVYRMYDLLQEQLDIEQVCRIVSFLLHFTQHPLMTSANFKYRILTYVNTIIKTKFFIRFTEPAMQKEGVTERVIDLQLQSLYCITKVVKYLHEQTDQAIEFFKENNLGTVDLDNTVGEAKKITEGLRMAQKAGAIPGQDVPMNGPGSEQPCTKNPRQKTLPIDSIFILQEQDIVDAYNDSFMVSWRTISQIEDFRRTSTQSQDQQVLRTATKNLQQKKEWIIKTAKQAFFTFNYIQMWLYVNQQTFDLKGIKLYKRFIVTACHLLQNLTEIMPNEEITLKHLSKLLKTIMTSYVTKPMQFKDILNAVGEDLFGLCVEAKVKGNQFGIDYLCRLLMTFETHLPMPINRMKEKNLNDQYTAYFLETFFEYLKVKTEVFDVKNENESEVPRSCLSKQDKRLAKLPFQDLQEAMQGLILAIGEQTLKHSNDNKVKHTFFSVFMFCMQKIRSGFIVPKYFKIIRSLLKDVMQTDEKDEKKEVMRDFMPIVQGLLETFLQAKDEATYVKETTSEICCLMPAKIRHLLEQLPAISIPLIDSMQSRSSNTSIHTIQYWHVVLNQYPFLLDPILSKILPELNQSIQGTILPFMPHSMKLIGKLGAKSRLYEANNKFNSRNFPEDGLKITLKDKNSQQTITFGIDSVIDVLFFQLSYKDSSYQNQVLMQAANLVKSAFLCYVDPNLDIDFIVATIVATRNNQQKPSAEMFAKNGIRAPQFRFNAREKQIFVSQMGRGCESHAFVKLLRCAIMGYKALSSTPDEHKKMQSKQNNFLKWITQYFCLIYIVKNEQLTNTMVDEINPLVFIDMIVELLYHYIDSNQLSSKAKDFPFYKGSAVALKTLIRFLRELYGNSADIFNNLEIISILIKRICNQVQEPRKNIAINIAIRILIKELPNYAVVRHSETLMNRLFLILNQSSDSVVKSIEERVRPTLEQLFEALGMYEICERVNEKSMSLHFNMIEMLQAPNAAQTPEIQFFIETLDRILQNVLCTQEVTQEVAMDLIQQVAQRNDVKVCQLLRHLPHQKDKRRNWSNFIFEQEILMRASTIFDMYKSGYGQIQQLISYLNIVKFYLKFEEGKSIKERTSDFLKIADCVILILEDECTKLDACYDPQQPNKHLYVNQNTSITRIAKRYNKLERMYQSYNKDYDPYTHTLHPHQVFNSHFFEVSQQAKEEQHKDEIEAMRQQQAYPVIFERYPNAQAEEAFANRILRMQEGQANQQQLTGVETAKRVLNTTGDQKRIRDLISRRIDNFISSMFGPSQSSSSASGTAPQAQRPAQSHPKVHDVSNSYMRNLYEMYPNVRLHTEMICKCMDLLCEISSHSDLSQLFAQCLDEFYKPEQSSADSARSTMPSTTVIDLSDSFLQTPLDFYIVEIKAKIICCFFKFFQRDEKNIQKMSKKCMKKLLLIQNPYHTPAFPNRILRDCIRPILFSIQPNQKQVQQFQHLGRIIKVLHNYFTVGLGQAILNNLQDLQKQIREEYRFVFLPQSRDERMGKAMQQQQQFAANQRAGQIPGAVPQDPSQPIAPIANPADNNLNQVGPDGQPAIQPRMIDKEIVERELDNLVQHHNIKVQQISCAVGIINTLHLFYQRTDSVQQDFARMTVIVRQLLDFQKYLVEDFRENFEKIFDEVLLFLPAFTQQQIVIQMETRQKFQDMLNPLPCKLGFLHSDILQGLEKFYNKNVYQAQKILWQNEPNRDLTEMVLEILNRKENYCIRQALSLDIVLQDYDQRGNRRGDFSQSFLNLISLVYSYSKFYPQCLKYQNNTDILDILREKWLNKDTPRNLTPQMAREIYMKIQKTLVIYCKNESADAQILFDLLKDFFCQIQLDLKPLVTLCTIEIPQNASIQRKENIMETALTKIETSQTSYEAKYYMFEFAFMPLALTCANDKQKFDELFKPKLISKFIETFFSKIILPTSNGTSTREQWIWEKIQAVMEKRQKISYQSFFTEIIKVLIIIMRHISSFNAFLECASINRQRQDILIHIIKFLSQIIKTASCLTLKSYAFFAITCFGLRLLGLPVDSKGSEHDQSIASQNPNNYLQQELFTLLRDSVQNPLLQLELEQDYDSSFRQISKRLNDLTTIEKQRQMMHHTEKLNQQYFKIHNRTLIQNTFSNLQRIFEDPRVQNQIRNQIQQTPNAMRQDDQWSSFKRQFSLRPSVESRVALCLLIGNTSMLNTRQNVAIDEGELNYIKMTYERVLRRVEKTIKQFLCIDQFETSLQSLQQNEKILSLIETMYNWIMQIYRQQQFQLAHTSEHQRGAAVSQFEEFQKLVSQRLGQYLTLILYKLFLPQLKYLNPKDKLIQHIKSQAEENSYETKNEFIEFVEHCFSLADEIFQQIPQKQLMLEVSRPEENDAPEKLALKTTFIMNLLAMSTKSKEQQPDTTRRYLTDFLQNTCVPLQEIAVYPNYFLRQTTPLIQVNYKPMSAWEKAQQMQAGTHDPSLSPLLMNLNSPQVNKPAHAFSEQTYQINMILHPIHVIVMAIRQSKQVQSSSQAAQEAAYLMPFVKQAIWYDVRRALDRDMTLIQKQLVQYFFNKHIRTDAEQQSAQVSINQATLPLYTQHIIMKSIQSSVSEEQKTVQKCIPHFAIRIINKLEGLVDEGVLSKEEFEQWVDPDLYKEISKIIQQAVTVFKLVICSDKSMNKTIDKVLNQPISGSGYYNTTTQAGVNPIIAEEKPEIEKIETYVDYEFKGDTTDFRLKQINQDIWMKESIIVALKSIVKRMKTAMNQEDILVTLSQLRMILKSFYFESMKTCDYIMEQAYFIIKYLVEDQPEQRIRLNAKEKLQLFNRLISLSIQKSTKESQPSKQDPNANINKVTSLFLDYLESQPNILLTELFLKHYDKVFMLNLLCSYEIRQRQFAIFEKFFGSSLKAKIVYFFNKLSLVNKPGQDNFEMYKDNADLEHLLEVTFYNFNENVSLQKIKNSTNLCPLSNPLIKLEGNEALRQSQDGKRILAALKPFHTKYIKYVTKQSDLKHLMKPLTEIIRINPEHNMQDKNIAEKIFSKVFWQYWHILDRTDQQYLAESFNKVFLNFIRFTSMLQSMPHMKQQFARTLLEQVASLKEPQVRIEPEILQYMGKHFNLWHVSIPLLEDHVQLYSNNERYVHSLQELYNGLMEEDLSVGLSRIITKSPEMRSMYTFSQHHQWEEINSLFGQYINFYAEQEGLLEYLEDAQKMPGKYSRQLAKTHLIDMINDQVPQPRQATQQIPTEGTASYEKVFENSADIAQKLQNRKFPRPGGNRNISDIDLRSWENLYMTSLKILKKSELFKDVADNMNRFELIIEHYWQKKECRRLVESLGRVLMQNQPQQNSYTISSSSLQRVRYHMYYNYVLSEQIGDSRNNANDIRNIRQKLDENYQQTQELAVKQITAHFPSYIDTVQNEYFILFQQILESQEGICNMLLEHDRRNYTDLRNMMNIWRERLPHKCETIQTWQDVLENRRYIFTLIYTKISRTLQATRAQQQQAVNISATGPQINTDGLNRQNSIPGGAESVRNNLTNADHRKLLEQVDIVWINLKLAEISRKHGMPNLAEYYQSQPINMFANDGNNLNGEIFKLEQFKKVYERFKLKMTYCKEPITRYDVLDSTRKAADNPEFTPWQQAELLRIIGEYYLKQGKIYHANETLLQSIEKNKREAKTWLAYAKLNDILFQNQKDEKSALNCLKGYFCAITLSQHKARLIIPNVFKLLKQKSFQDAAQLRSQQHQAMTGTTTQAYAASTTGLTPSQAPQGQAQQTSQVGGATTGNPNPITVGQTGLTSMPGQKLMVLVQKIARDMPKWLWIFWLPQILQFLTLPKEDTLQNMCKFICHYMCVSYPQVCWYPLKAITEYHRVQTPTAEIPPRSREQETQQGPNRIYETMCRKIIDKMNKKLVNNLMQVMKELHMISRATNDERLIVTLKRILNFSDHLQQKSTTERLWKNYIRQIYDYGYLNEQPEAKAEWERLIQNEDTNEKQQLEQIKIVKNIKDYLLIQNNMREQDIYLQEESPYLASFPQRGIELPGQYVLSEAEPRPENTIIIERMGTTIQRSGHKDKKINFRCTNGKNYYFTMSPFNSKEFKAQLQLERVTQLKVVSNMILKRHKESARRGVKLYAAPQVLSHFKSQVNRQQQQRNSPSQFNRLVQDDKTFGDLQETHDYLLQECGLDPDMALLLQVQHVQDIYDGKPISEREFARITETQIQQLNSSCYTQMRKEVKPHLLSSYFHRIFSNVDNMFIFKKQFTKYHAVNSFFTYVFNQADKQELSSLSFCKATGRINVQQANLRHALHLYREISQATNEGGKLNFQEIEAEIFKVPINPMTGDTEVIEPDSANGQKQKIEFYVPFRITPNIEQFIGKIGIQGLFAGVMTSASLAMSAQKDKTQVLIELLLSEELKEFKANHGTIDAVQMAQCENEAKKHAEFCMYKIQSLSEHKKIIQQPPKSEESKAGEPFVKAPGIEFDPIKGCYIFGNSKWKVPKEFLDLEMDRPDIPEEYNKKVFALIEMATDDTRRCQKSLTWCPWF